jgi:hypothetical protein
MPRVGGWRLVIGRGRVLAVVREVRVTQACMLSRVVVMINVGEGMMWPCWW